MIVETSRAYVSNSNFDLIFVTLAEWKATTEAVASGHTPDHEQTWLDTTQKSSRSTDLKMTHRKLIDTRPLQLNKYEIIFGTSNARKGWTDVLAALRSICIAVVSRQVMNPRISSWTTDLMAFHVLSGVLLETTTFRCFADRTSVGNNTNRLR